MSTEILKTYQSEVAYAMKCAAEDYIADNPPEKVVKQTLEVLEENRNDILHTLLGFEVDRWGKGHFKVDHCNGRGGESAVGDYLRREQSKAIENWLKTAELGELCEGTQADMRKEFNKIYRGRIESLVKEHAKQLALKHFNELVEQDALGDLANMDSLLNT